MAFTAEQKKAYAIQKSQDNQDKLFGIIKEGLENMKDDFTYSWKMANGGFIKNIHTKKGYRGVNVWSGFFWTLQNNFTDPRVGTRKQLSKEGYSFRGLKAGTGLPILFFDTQKIEKENKKTGEPEEYYRRFWKWSEVFCVEQCEDYVPPEDEEDSEPIPEHEMIAHCNAYIESQETLTLKREGMRAFYRVKEDLIQLPPHELFIDSFGEAATLLHEIAHSTGHESRLNRKLGNGFGSKEYAFEELIAELSSIQLTLALGGKWNPNSVLEENANNIAYLQSWIKACEDKDGDLLKAFSESQKVCDYVLDKMEKGE